MHVLVTTVVAATVATMVAPASRADDDLTMYRFGWCQELSRYQSALDRYWSVNIYLSDFFTPAQRRVATRQMKLTRNEALTAIRQDRSASARQYAVWFELAHYHRVAQGDTAQWKNAARNADNYLHMYCGIVGNPTPFV